MSFVSYKSIRDSAVTQIATAFGAWRGLKVEAHPGRFDEEEVRRLFAQTPALLTSLMRIMPGKQGDNQRLEFVTWVLVRADNRDPLFDQALLLLSVLTPVLQGLNTEWSYNGAEDVEATNLFTGALAGINATLWAVKWSWPLRATTAPTPDEVTGVIEEGGILLPDELEDFAGADGKTSVGDQTMEEKIET